MILLMVSSGVRIGALHTMQIGDLIPVRWRDDFNLFKVQIYARTHDSYYSFCTPECAEAIKEYLDYRSRCHEEIKDKSPLFRKHFNKQDPFIINIPYFLSEYAVMKAVDEALKRSGVKTSEAMRSHAYRKGFKSICEQSGMKSINVEWLLGHDIGVSGHYYRPTESEVLQDYLKAIDLLTIDPTKRLQKENQELKSVQAEKIAKQAEEIAILKEEMERNKKTVDHALAMVEAVKGAIAAKSEAAKFSLNL